MEIATILRQLWRTRRVVLAIGVVALLAAFAVAFRVSFPPKLESRKHVVGIATTRILVDTPDSQLVSVAPRGSEALGLRANLIANLMVNGVVKTDIASRAGLRPSQLGAVTEPVAPGAPPPAPAQEHELTARVITDTSGDNIPVIEIEARAPTVAGAARLAGAAVSGLRQYLVSKAASQPTSNARRLRVTGLGAAQVSEEVQGPGPLVAFGAGLLVFVGGCAILLLVLGILPNWRLLDDIEEFESLAPPPKAPDGAGPAGAAAKTNARTKGPSGRAAKKATKRARQPARASSER